MCITVCVGGYHFSPHKRRVQQSICFGISAQSNLFHSIKSGACVDFPAKTDCDIARASYVDVGMMQAISVDDT